MLDRPPLALDPVVLDAAGQLVGFWTAEQLPRARVVFPFRLAALDVFGPLRPIGEPLTGVAEIALVGEHLTRSDIDVLDADGRLWMRLSGWEDKRFDLPPSLESACRSAATAHRCPRPGPRRSLGARAADTTLQCRRLAVPGAADADLWGRIWAQRVLGPVRARAVRGPARPGDAQDGLARGRAPPPRRRSPICWPAGDGRQVDPRDIELVADERGRPLVGGPALAGLGVTPEVSVSHSAGHAVALASLHGAPGIDLELAGALPDGFAQVAFTEAERRLLAGLPEPWALCCYCAKEAAGKALGTGLPRGPRDMDVTAVDAEEETVLVRRSGTRRPGAAGALRPRGRPRSSPQP